MSVIAAQINDLNEQLITICEHIEGLPCCVQAGEAGGFRRDGSPALQGSLQGGGPVGNHPKRLAAH